MFVGIQICIAVRPPVLLEFLQLQRALRVEFAMQTCQFHTCLSS